MSDDDGVSLPVLGVAVGLVLGSAVGTLGALATGVAVPSLVGYGTGGGLVVGGFAGKLVAVNRGEDRFDVRAAGGGGAIGLVVGAGVGGLAAWSLDASLVAGSLAGAAAGLGHGLLVGGVLLATVRRREGTVDLGDG